MTVKQLAFREDARDKVRRGVDALAEAVKVTLVPRGRTVILDRGHGPPQIVNCGALGKKANGLDDRFENRGAQLLREVAARTSEMAGDGSTSATVLAHAMIQQGLRYLAGGMNPMDLKRGMEQAVEAVVEEPHPMALPCASSQEVARLASTSADNDSSIGELLAAAIDKLGREGATSDCEKEQLDERISPLSGGIAVIKVGAAHRDRTEGAQESGRGCLACDQRRQRGGRCARWCRGAVARAVRAGRIIRLHRQCAPVHVGGKVPCERWRERVTDARILMRCTK